MPTSIEALVIAALVLTPGYVFTQLARRVIAHIEETTDVRFLLTILAAGTTIHGLAFPWTSHVLDYYLDKQLNSHRWEVYVWAILVVLIAPVALGILVGRMSLWGWVESLLDKIGLGYVDRMPSAWDYVMRREQAGYVRIRLKDDRGFVGGVFANRSFGSLDPRRADLYLETAWILDADGTFVASVPDSQGVWISHDVMAYVDFFEGEDKPYGRQQTESVPDSLETGTIGTG